eukprot:scaffold112047_cov19-Prasinocladus_malaysianus.AAC.1
MAGWRKEGDKKESTIETPKRRSHIQGRTATHELKRPLLTIAVPLLTITSSSWCHYVRGNERMNE